MVTKINIVLRYIFSLIFISLFFIVDIYGTDSVSLDDIQNLEKLAMWDSASAIINQLDDNSAAIESHKTKLDFVRKTVQNSREYLDEGLSDEAMRLLTSLKMQFDQNEDLSLFIGINKEIQNLKDTEFGEYRKVFENQLEMAENQFKNGDYQNSFDLYDSVIHSPFIKHFPSLHEKAQQGRLKLAFEIQKESAIGSKYLENKFQKLLIKVLEISFYIILALSLIYVLMFLKSIFLKKQGIGLLVEDHTVNQDERKIRNHDLSQHLAHVIRSLTGANSSDSEQNDLMDLDSSNLPSVPLPLGGIATIGTTVDAIPLKIGLFSISPSQIITYISLLFKPQYRYNLKGILEESDNKTHLRIEKVGDGEAVQFESSAPGTTSGSRERAIREVATQIVISSARTAVTQNWRSLHQYMLADELLVSEFNTRNREELLNKALQHLISSLRYDPANWMSRFKLATVQRKLGKNMSASEQFEYIERMLDSDELWESQHFNSFIQSNPEFLWIVRYNRAISLSKRNLGDSNETALIYLEKLISMAEQKMRSIEKNENHIPFIKKIFTRSNTEAKPLTYDENTDIFERNPKIIETLSRINKTNARQMLILAKGARAAALCVKMEMIRDQRRLNKIDPDDSQREMHQIFRRIKEDEKWLWNYVKEVSGGDWQSYASAHAVAQNAYGRACYLLGKYGEAKRFLEWAIRIHMPYNLIDPYINLASLYFNRKEKMIPDWDKKVEQLLLSVLELSPHNKKAHYLLGRFYSHRKIKKYHEALRHYKVADDFSWSYFLAGIIYIEQLHNLQTGLELIIRSIDYDPIADFRIVRFVEIVLKYSNNKLVDATVIKKARKSAAHLKENGTSARYRSKGAELLNEIETLYENLHNEDELRQES